MTPYIHKVHYYETDQMKVVHHGNYIHWMEEARIAFLEEIDCSYEKLEQMGLISPIVNVEISYKSPAKFNDDIQINLKITKYDGLVFIVNYQMVNIKTKAVVAIGETKSCFINQDGRLINLAKVFPEIHQKLQSYLSQENI